MHQRYRDKIKQHFVELVNNIEPDVLADFLLAKRALKKEEVDKIFSDRTDSKHTNRLLLFRILKKNDTVYRQFVECMELFGLKHLFVNSGNGFPNRTATVFHEADVQPVGEELPDLSNLTLNNRNAIESPDLNTTAAITESNRQPMVVNVKLSEKLQETDCDNIYNTTSAKRGQVLIINNELFNPKYHKKRTGSEIDLKCIRDLFEQMYMKVEFHENLNVEEMKEVIQQFSKFDADKISDICVVVIMSHGEERNQEFVILDKENNAIKTSWIEEQFSNVNCSLFFGKPKVFLYQACRGKRSDYATTKVKDDENRNNIEPVVSESDVHEAHREKQSDWDTTEQDNMNYNNNAEPIISESDVNHNPEGGVEFDSGLIHGTERRLEDILVGYPTQKGHRAHRDPQFGSWYIQTICEVFMTKAHNTHIVEMLNEVDRKLKNFASAEYTMQTSGYTSNGFNKFLYFNPGVYLDKSGNVQKFV